MFYDQYSLVVAMRRNNGKKFDKYLRAMHPVLLPVFVLLFTIVTLLKLKLQFQIRIESFSFTFKLE